MEEDDPVTIQWWRKTQMVEDDPVVEDDPMEEDDPVTIQWRRTTQ